MRRNQKMGYRIMKKTAVIFPGIGYHTEKPLLYYAKKLAKQSGYEITEVPYRDLFRDTKEPDKRLEAAFVSAFAQTEEILKAVSFAEDGDLLFISKSIGTVVASAYAEKYGLNPRHILYTPVKTTFSFHPREGIAFHGTADPMADTEMVNRACRECRIPLYLTENGNHSLETGNVQKDLENLGIIMRQTEAYIRQEF